MAKTSNSPDTKRKKEGDHTSSNKKLQAEPSVNLQQEAVDAVKAGENVFITGQGGVGKSHIIKIIIQHFHDKFKNEGLKQANSDGTSPSDLLGVVTPTGISAIALPNGQTIHSFSGVGVPDTKEDFGNIWNKKAKMWRNLRVLIIDEISMLDAEFLDYLSEEVCNVRETPTDVPFGGIQLIFCGDFLQLSPIARPMKDIHKLISAIKDPSKMYNARGFAFQSNVWKNANLQVAHLEHIYRQDNFEFQEALGDLRLGNVSDKTEKFFNSCARKLPEHKGIEATELYATNDDVDNVNIDRLDKLQDHEIIYSSNDYVNVDLEDEAKASMAEDFLWNLPFFNSCIARRSLSLKPNAQVMRIKNEKEGDLANGSRGIVIGFAKITAKDKEFGELEDGDYDIITENYNSTHLPVVRYLNGKEKIVQYEEFLHRVDGIGSCARSQIPLKLAWAITIHKSQGMSIDYMKADLSKVFAEGQVYVALSRARNKEGLELRGFSKNIVKANERALSYYKDPNADFPHWSRPWNVAEEAMTETEVASALQAPTAKEGALQDLKIVVTGEPEGISRDELETLIRECNGNVMTTVSGKTNYLVIGSSGSFGDGRDLISGNKYKKAKKIREGQNKSNLQILNQAEFYELINKASVPAASAASSGKSCAN